MDDNRLLTLPNGERIRLMAHCRLLFEVQWTLCSTNPCRPGGVAHCKPAITRFHAMQRRGCDYSISSRFFIQGRLGTGAGGGPPVREPGHHQPVRHGVRRRAQPGVQAGVPHMARLAVRSRASTRLPCGRPVEQQSLPARVRSKRRIRERAGAIPRSVRFLQSCTRSTPRRPSPSCWARAAGRRRARASSRRCRPPTSTWCSSCASCWRWRCATAAASGSRRRGPPAPAGVA
jgi:hypothetical protein